MKIDKFAVLERKADKLYAEAKLGSSVVLKCPIESIPAATILWNFNNGTNITFDYSDR